MTPLSFSLAAHDITRTHISGSASISIPLNTDPTVWPAISINLIRTVILEQSSTNVGEHKGGFFERIRCRRSPRQGTSQSMIERCSSEEKVIQSNLWHQPELVENHAPSEMDLLRFPFSIPLPDDIPPTTETVLGKVSYVIEAQTDSGICARQPVDIPCRSILDGQTVDYARAFPGQRLSTQTFLTRIRPDSRVTARYAAKEMVYQTVTKGVRATETKYATVKELRWRVEETVQAVEVCQDTTRCKRQIIRQLAAGKQTGHWIATGTDGQVAVAFEIAIPQSANAADEIDISLYSLGLAITVSHRLMLDVIIGEDTFDQGTGKLVDRKPRVRSLNASFPISVDCARGDEEGLITHGLPQYDGTAMPPDYEPER